MGRFPGAPVASLSLLLTKGEGAAVEQSVGLLPSPHIPPQAVWSHVKRDGRAVFLGVPVSHRVILTSSHYSLCLFRHWITLCVAALQYSTSLRIFFYKGLGCLDVRRALCETCHLRKVGDCVEQAFFLTLILYHISFLG